MFPTILPRRYAPAASVQSSYLTLSGCQLLSQGGPRVRLARHQRRQQALRRQRCAARRIGGCDKHCEYNDALPDRFSQGQRGRDVRCGRTIINAQLVSEACPPLYCPGATRPKQACSCRTSRFRVASCCRRVDLVCD
jgi:hypothetical protein